MAAPFDPTPYVRSPIITVSSGVTLALALVEACPQNAPPNVKKAANYLKSVAEQARTDLAERNRKLGVFSEEDWRVLDNEADRCWGGLQTRLVGMSMLSPERVPRAARAPDALRARGHPATRPPADYSPSRRSRSSARAPGVRRRRRDPELVACLSSVPMSPKRRVVPWREDTRAP